eukprot:9481530-Lingulodinium_polyedra.AAC.1
MMRLKRRFAAAAARGSHVCVRRALAGSRSAFGARERAVCGAHRQHEQHLSNARAAPRQDSSSTQAVPK